MWLQGLAFAAIDLCQGIIDIALGPGRRFLLSAIGA